MHFAAKAGHINVVDKLAQKKANLEMETTVSDICNYFTHND
jgi:hypothetical protein